MNHPALGRGHRLELDLLTRLEGALGGSIGLSLDRLAATLTVPGRIHHDALSVLAAAKCRPVTEQLNRIDRLPPPTDQQADVLALDPPDDLLVVLLDLDVRVDSSSSTTRSRMARTRSTRLSIDRFGVQRRFFRFRGGGGGASRPSPPPRSAWVAVGINCLTTHCCPIVQRLVVIQ